MKKLVKVLGSSLLAVGILAGCGSGNNENDSISSGNNSNDGDDLQTLIVGANNVPHAEILEVLYLYLKKKGST